jgi:solute carrier family 25 carnitine/acylcarnitine transporter 20/29
MQDHQTADAKKTKKLHHDLIIMNGAPEIATQTEVSVAHDLIAGGIAGSASVIVGHPFDTIKVRLQTASASSNVTMMSSFQGKGGIQSLFRGMAAPLSTAAMVNAIIFAAYGTSSRWWDQYYPYDGNYNAIMGLTREDHNEYHTASIQASNALQHDPWQKSFLCGSFAGLCQALVICPMEHLKCRLQLPDSTYKGPLQAAKSIVSSHGIPGLYRGINSTLIREIPAFGAYFSVYDAVKDSVNSYFDTHNSDSSQHMWLASAFAGGVSGSFTWAMIYPIDVIKTRIQTSPMAAPKNELQIYHVGRTIVKEHGWRFLFRGLNVTLIRAFPVNGIIFPVYEFTLSYLTDL